MTKKTILCLGRTLRDTVLRPVAHFPARFDALRADEMFDAPGGGGATTAAVLAKLGNRVYVAGCIGADASGEYVRRELLDAGVNLSMTVSVPEKETSIGVVAVDEHGEARYFYSDGIDSELTMDRLAAIDLSGIDLIHVANANQLITQEGEPLVSWLKLAQQCSHPPKISIDTAKQKEFADRVPHLLPHVDYFFANYIEASRVVLQDSLRQIGRQLMESGVREAVFVKLGEHGTYWRTADGNDGHQPGFIVSNVNENGAGDVLCAVVLHHLLGESTIADATRYGCAAAAAHVSTSRGIVYPRGLLREHGQFESVQKLPHSGPLPLDSDRPVGYWPVGDYGLRHDNTREIPREQMLDWVERIRIHGKLTKDSRILDAGCGTGRFAIPIADLVDCEIVAVDRDSTMLDRARKKDTSQKVAWKKADLERMDSTLGSPAGTFDCVWLSSVFPQITDYSLLFDQLKRHLRRGGRLLIRSITRELLTTESVAWYKWFPAALEIEKRHTPSIQTIWRFLDELRFVLSYVELCPDLQYLQQRDFFYRFEHKGFVWCDKYTPGEYERCLESMRNSYAANDLIPYQNPSYFIVAERR